MFSLNDSMRYWLYNQPTDMRNRGLTELILYTLFVPFPINKTPKVLVELSGFMSKIHNPFKLRIYDCSISAKISSSLS
jgi:hypothetical protein